MNVYCAGGQHIGVAKHNDMTLAGLVLKFVRAAHVDYSFSTRSAPQFYER
ncbi:MAG: hypothetical protein PUF39_05015 [Prevotellaceae bacterium]|nr:hypothetical protein [Prevotellaceae bacterium]